MMGAPAVGLAELACSVLMEFWGGLAVMQSAAAWALASRGQ